MDTRPGWRTPLSALAFIAAACGTQDRLPVEPTVQADVQTTQLSQITGSVLGPDGRSICRTVTADNPFFVLAIPEDPLLPFGDGGVLICPDNEYSIPVEPGRYRLRAEFFTYDGIGRLPVATIMPPVEVESEGEVRNIRMREGTPLGGGATLDGEPFAGVPIFAFHEFFFGFGIGGMSDRSGGWDDVFPLPPQLEEIRRSPMILQNDVPVFIGGECFRILGTVVTGEFPFEEFVFPSERRRVDCQLETGPARRVTHTRNRTAVTAFPADIGGLTEGVRDFDLGTGFGVQFPSRPGRLPVHDERTSSHLFMGGLMIGVSPDVILTGIDGGYLECRFDLENGCRDLGLDASVEVTRLPNGGRVVTWRYSDAPSGEGVGLRVTQRSFDAPAGDDYVLFRFTIRNGSGVRLNINPGLFADFDLDDDFFDDLAHRQRGGRLLSQTNAAGPATRVGTLMIGETDPTPGFFFTGGGLPLADQIAVLRGNRSGTVAGPDDLRYIQSVRAIGLSPGAETDLWVAVIAGENNAAFAETADAAAADIQRRRQSLASGALEAAGVNEWSFTSSPDVRAERKPVCGKDCMLERLGRIGQMKAMLAR